MLKKIVLILVPLVLLSACSSQPSSPATEITVEMTDFGSTAHHAHGAEQNFDLHISARTGESSILQLTVSEPGTYKIFCSVEGHEEAGMAGELTVLDQE